MHRGARCVMTDTAFRGCAQTRSGMSDCEGDDMTFRPRRQEAGDSDAYSLVFLGRGEYESVFAQPD